MRTVMPVPVALRRSSVAAASLALLAAAAVAPEASARPSAVASAAPLTLLQAPARKTRSTTATFRFRAPGGTPRCRRDAGPFRPCRGSIVLSGLTPGTHVLTIHVRRDGRVTTRRHRWTVLPRFAGREVVFRDDFDGTTLDPAWSPYDGPGHAGRGLRKPAAITLDGAGHLVITAQTIGEQLVSGGMALRRSTTYGRIEFRVRTEIDPTGTMSGVVLIWPSSEAWPQDGELDVYETGAKPGARSPFRSFVHYGADNRQYEHVHQADATAWHTMAMEWTPQQITVFRDGEPVWRLDDPAAIPDVPHHLCIQLDPVARRTLDRPVRMLVDWVRVLR